MRERKRGQLTIKDSVREEDKRVGADKLEILRGSKTQIKGRERGRKIERERKRESERERDRDI